ncbi:MAG: sugar phosphate isomerase/epimerase [Armatimonadetes bacterium]|nr:sugar phosphate isomerase/epimerase [Armatimonadota bacterium]
MYVGVVTDEISQDFEKAVELAVGWGVKAVEIRGIGGARVPDFSAETCRRIGRILEDNGVALTSISPGLLKTPPDARAIESHLKERAPRSFEMADALGTRTVVCFTPLRPEGLPVETPLPRACLEAVRALAEQAGQAGVTLLLENETASYIATGRQTAALLAEIGHPGLGVNWDATNAYVAGESAFPKGYEAVRSAVRHVHLKDAVRIPGGQWRYVTLGEGEVGWPAQIAALKKDGYAGPLLVETHFGPGEEATKGCVEALKRMLQLQQCPDSPKP